MDHSRWLRRPLEKSALQYAASDIHKICLLYESFVKSGYITSDSLVRQSASYIALHAKCRPNGSDKYNRHGLLPLALLAEPQAVPVIQCRGCKRDLPHSAFSQSGYSVGTNVACFVCKAVDAKATAGRHVRYLHTYDDLENDDDLAHIYEDLENDEDLDHIYEDLENDEDLANIYEDLDHDDGIWDESFYDGDY